MTKRNAIGNATAKKLLQPKSIITMLIATALIWGFRQPITSSLASFTGMEQQKPLELEIDGIQSLIGKLIPDIEDHVKRVVDAKTEANQAQRFLTESESNFQQKLLELKQIRAAEKSGQDVPSDLVVATLLDEVENLENIFRHNSATADSRSNQLMERQDELKSLVDRKHELEVQIANFRARLASVNSRQEIEDFSGKESKLIEQCKSKAEEVASRLEVAEQLLAMQDNGLISSAKSNSLASNRTQDVFDSVDEYLSTLESRSLTTRNSN